MSPEAYERQVQTLCSHGLHREAAQVGLRRLGPEVFGFLAGVLRSEDDAQEIFSLFAERFWSNLPGFRWGCSLRTWAYVIARNESRRFQRREASPRNKRASLSEAGELAEVIRSETVSLLKTERRSKLLELRDELEEEDRALLVLRVDRGLDWQDVARAMSSTTDDELEPEELRREAARLRKRFQLLRERLRGIATSRGLI
jgi:RNA polymerase sigma-70 factor (ECF subfamily)